MSADRANDMDPGSIEPQHPLEKVLDLIARNDKDVDRPQTVIRTAEMSRSERASVLAVSGPAPAGQPWGQGHTARAVAHSPAEMVASVLRYKWTLILVSILVSAPLVAAIWTQIVPQYQSRAEVRVRPIIPRLVFRTEDNGAIPFYESFVNTQVSMIRGPTVLQRVLDKPEVQQTKWYKNAPKTLLERLRGDSTPPSERLRESLSVSPRPRTEIIDVSFMDADAGEAKLIVDAVLEEYLRYTKEATNKEDDELYRQLTDQYTSLDRQIKGQEDTCARLRQSLETQSPEELISTKRVHLDETEARLAELRNTIAILQWEIARTATQDSNGVPSVVEAAPETQPEYYVDEEWRRLDLNVKTIQHQIGSSVQRPNHPDSLRLAKDLEFSKQLLKERETQLDEQWRHRPANVGAVPLVTAGAGLGYENTMVPLEHQLARAEREEELLRTAYEAEKSQFANLFESAQLLSKETTTLQHKRELFDAVRQRLDQKSIERNVPGSIDVIPAFSPSKPGKDRRVVFTAMALFCGFGLGGGIAFLRASRDKTICAFKDMPQPAQAPFLGHVPLIQTTKPLGKSLCDEIEQNQFLLVESIRILRTALLSRLDDSDHESGTTVLVTSAGEGTGKSSFTMMLGKSIAQAGRKVLMIDADFHKMTLSRRFELLEKVGFVDILNDKTMNGLPIFPTKTPGLDVMPAGRRNSDNAVFEEIANGAFKSCIGRIRQQYSYDIILLDTAPVLPVADATILARQVDGTIMVEREHVSQRTHVIDALTRLGSTGGRLLGTVFVGSFSRERYGYGYGYGYGQYGKTRKS